MNYSNLSEREIDILVSILVARSKNPKAKSVEYDETQNCIWVESAGFSSWPIESYCDNWANTGPIIVDNSIQFNYDTCQVHCDSYFAPDIGNVSLARNQALRAAMIVYLMMKEAENEV